MRKYVNSHLGKSSHTTFINSQLNLQKTQTPTFTNPLENGPNLPSKKGGVENVATNITKALITLEVSPRIYRILQKLWKCRY